MGLGVSQSYSFEKNVAIVIQKYEQNPTLTLKQAQFLVLCWKGRWREEARKIKAELMAYIKLSPEDKAIVLNEAKRIYNISLDNLNEQPCQNCGRLIPKPMDFCSSQCNREYKSKQ